MGCDTRIFQSQLSFYTRMRASNHPSKPPVYVLSARRMLALLKCDRGACLVVLKGWRSVCPYQLRSWGWHLLGN